MKKPAVIIIGASVAFALLLLVATCFCFVVRADIAHNSPRLQAHQVGHFSINEQITGMGSPYEIVVIEYEGKKYLTSSRGGICPVQ